MNLQAVHHRAQDRRSVWVIIALICVLIGATFVWLIPSIFLSSGEDQSAVVARDYAQNSMTWTSGPTIESSHLTTLSTLGSAIMRYVPPGLQRHVNVPDLIRRFGSHRRVALVVLRGVYNSLPPDEGIVVRGEVVAVVDTQTRSVALLTN